MPRKNGLADSLLVRLHNQYRKLPDEISRVHQSELLINYRCHPDIVRLPSRLFYDCRIQVCVCVCLCVTVYACSACTCLFVDVCCVSIIAVLILIYDLSMPWLLQTRAKSVPHPGWEKMVYFVCSSFALKAPAADSQWSTQKELLAEAELEVQELKQLVQKFIHPKSKDASLKTTSGVNLSEMDLSSVCVLFPTRLTVSAVHMVRSGYKCMH